MIRGVWQVGDGPNRHGATGKRSSPASPRAQNVALSHSLSPDSWGKTHGHKMHKESAATAAGTAEVRTRSFSQAASPAAGGGLHATRSFSSSSLGLVARPHASPTAGNMAGAKSGGVPAQSGPPVSAQRIRDKIRLRGKKMVWNAVERVRDTSVAVTRVLRAQADAVEWSICKQMTGHTDGIWDVAVCPWENKEGFSQETLLASASADRTGRIWAVESGREVATLVGHKGSVNSICFHPYQALVCTASGDKSCNVWRLPSLTGIDQDRDCSDRDHEASSFSSSSRSMRRASGTAAHASVLRPVLGLWGHSNAVSGAAWMSSCGLIATASWDRSALLFDVASGASKPLRTLAAHDGPLSCIAAATCAPLVSSLLPSCTPCQRSLVQMSHFMAGNEMRGPRLHACLPALHA